MCQPQETDREGFSKILGVVVRPSFLSFNCFPSGQTQCMCFPMSPNKAGMSAAACVVHCLGDAPRRPRQLPYEELLAQCYLEGRQGAQPRPIVARECSDTLLGD